MAYKNRNVVKSETVNVACTKRQKDMWSQVAEMAGEPLGVYARKCIDMATRAFLKSKGLEFDVSTKSLRPRR